MPIITMPRDPDIFGPRFIKIQGAVSRSFAAPQQFHLDFIQFLILAHDLAFGFHQFV